MKIIFIIIAVLAVFAFGAFINMYNNYAEVPKDSAKHSVAIFWTSIIIISIALLTNLLFCVMHQEKMELNTDLPDDMYYLGVEIWRSRCLENHTYEYTFGCVDSMEMAHEGISYVWNSDVPLRVDVPYILTMDGMGTEDVKDDKICCVWQLAN